MGCRHRWKSWRCPQCHNGPLSSLLESNNATSFVDAQFKYTLSIWKPDGRGSKAVKFYYQRIKSWQIVSELGWPLFTGWIGVDLFALWAWRRGRWFICSLFWLVLQAEDKQLVNGIEYLDAHCLWAADVMSLPMSILVGEPNCKLLPLRKICTWIHEWYCQSLGVSNWCFGPFWLLWLFLVPDICNFLVNTHTFPGLKMLHSKVRKFATNCLAT